MLCKMYQFIDTEMEMEMETELKKITSGHRTVAGFRYKKDGREERSLKM